ncbi:MAG: hypothetical protein ACYTDW_15285 [Planctomycetota bacterium]
MAWSRKGPDTLPSARSMRATTSTFWPAVMVNGAVTVWGDVGGVVASPSM